MSTHDIIEGIKERQANIAALKKILKDMDPASGVTIAIRRGVAADGDQEFADGVARRPWVQVETGNLGFAAEAISAALRAAEESLSFRIRNAEADRRELGAFLDDLHV